MAYKLTNYERETIITFNEQDKTADVFTYNNALINKLDKLCSTRPDEVQLIDINSVGGKTYIVPKKWVKVSASMILTEEQRRERSEHGKRVISNLQH